MCSHLPRLLLLLCLLSASSANAQRVSLVWDGDYDDDDGSVSTDTYARRHALESLGFPVRLENPNNSESWYDTYGATSLYDVIYVSGESNVAMLANKLRDHQTAVIYETPEMDAAFGLSSSVGSSTDGTLIQIDTVGHPVTAASALGNASLYTSSNPISVLQGTPAGSLQALASQGGQTCLAVVETGGTLANTIDGNATATTRRVRLPFGAQGTNWSEVTGATLELMEQAVVWAAAPNYTPTSTAGVCVMLTADNGTLNDEEIWRVRRLTYDGWAVVLVWDGDSQANYDTAIAAADVVYVTTEASAADVGDKLRTAACGVVYENNELDDNLGLATGGGVRTATTGFYTRDREHPITANMYLDEYVSCFYQYDYAARSHPGANQELGRMSGTLAPDLRVLGTRWSDPVLAVIESGDQLANTIGGNGTAAGRRVRLPWVGAADLTTMPSWAEGSQIWYEALRWAAGSQTGTLIAHYKLDETSGTTAADSSGNGYDGEYRGGVMQNITPAPRRIAANFDATGEYIFAPTNSDFANLTASNGDFSVAFWIRPHEVTHAEWRNIFHIGGASSGDRGPLIMLHPTLRRFYCWVSTTSVATGTGGYSDFELSDEEWVHVAVVKSGSYLRWYLNGEFSNTESINGASVATAGDLRIGEQSWWGRPDADLDDIRVYSYAISDRDIAELHADLVLHFKLDEGTGTVATDSSIFGNDGTLEGPPAWHSDAPVDGCLDFEVADGADLVRGPSLDVGNDALTIAVWFNQETPSNDARLIVNSVGNSQAQQTWGLTVDENGELDFRVTANGAWDRVQAPSVVSPGVWQHGAATYDGSQMRLYLNGILVAQKAHSAGGAMDFDASHLVTLGDSAAGGRSFDGQLDDARVYRRTLTDAEIFELGGSGLHLHLKFNGTSGTVAEDSSPFGLDATVASGSPEWTEAVRYNGARFDGVDDTFVLDDDFDPPAAGTVAFWVRTTDTPTDFSRLFGVETYWEARYLSDGRYRMEFGHYDGPEFASPVDTINRWRHLAFSYDAADDSYAFYVDGTLVEQSILPEDISDRSAGTLTIGTRTGTTDHFAGDLDDLRVYDRVLTAEEIADIYGHIGHWRLDEIAGATAAVDETVFANDGVYEATPTLEEESPYPSDAVRTAATFEPGDHVKIPAAEHLEVGSNNADFSVAYWLRNNRENSGQWRETVKKHSSGRERTFAMWLRPYDERLYCAISTDNYWSENVNTNATFDVGVWRHVAYVKRGSQLLIYVDGVLDATDNLSGAVFSNNGNIHLGVRSASWRSDVTIDDFRVYSRALNDWEVAQLHGLVGQWKLEEVTGTVATDSSGMRRHGTYLGNPRLGAEDGPKSGTLAATFDGIDDLVLLPAIRDNFTQGFGLAGWARPTANGNYERIINLSEGTADYLGLGRRATSNSLYGIGHTDAWVDNALHNDVWRHYAVSVDDTGMMTFFRNGIQLSASQSVTLPSDTVRTTNSIGGTLTGGSEEGFTGRLHDVRLYNRPISRAEARELYYGKDVPGLRIVTWVEVANP